MPTVCSLSTVTVADPKLVDFLQHAGVATGLFVLNLILYEFIVIISVVLLMYLYVGIRKLIDKISKKECRSEYITDGIMYFAMRASIVAMVILMMLWVLNIYRLVPIPQ